MIIEILGTGCSKCEKLEKNLDIVIKDLDIDPTIVKVEDFKEIAKYGVMQTPGLVINGKVETVGKTPSVKQLKKLLSK